MKPLDFISSKKINKTNVAKIQFVNGEIIKDNNDTKNDNEDAIQSKLNELTKKLDKYETMAQNLGKEYSKSILSSNINK